jgi:hypothetical protein
MIGNGRIRRVLVTGLVAGVGAALISGVSLARAGGSSSDRMMRLTSTQTGSVFVSVTHTQQGAPGDEVIFHFALSKSGHHVGSLDAICTLLLGGQIQCQATYRLPGGTLSASTLFAASANGPSSVAITGGTGRYERATGQVTVNATGAKTAIDTFDIDT